MKQFYYVGKKPNFGDDLNRDLWSGLLPADVLSAPDVVLVGIGSILSEEWVGQFGRGTERVVVLGSGTSYDLPPRRISEWSVLAVRGPLTAALIGMPQAAVTDGAILLADLPDLIGPTRERSDILFMPHHRSIRRSPWGEIAAAAGMRYVSPQESVADILDAYAGAKLVVTEAMHGAIVADTLRIPWVPVTVAPTVDEFKWRDWCLSMGHSYQPAPVPAGDPRDALRYRRMHRVLSSRGVSGHQQLEGVTEREPLLEYFAGRFDQSTKTAVLRADQGGRMAKAQSAVVPLAGRRSRSQAVRALVAARQQRPYLSTDARFTSRLEQMRDALGQAIRIVREG